MLEIALQQEQWESCERILNWCEEGRARLVVPGYSLAEPHETLTRRQKDRKQVERMLNEELKRISRTAMHKEKLSGFDEIIEILTGSIEEEDSSLDRICLRLLRVADVVPLDATVLEMSERHRRKHGFSPQDAIVYASVLSDLDRRRSPRNLFISRDQDFNDQDIREELQGHDCDLILNFNDARQAIGSDLS